ncbi:hypothetical protein G7Y79_00033g068320 [Physcia stellaris]|nr:hypothetical protein G7Y79_00033g068320 [Physcia stellaris]
MDFQQGLQAMLPPKPVFPEPPDLQKTKGRSSVFLGLLVTLWAYKSLMLVVFQNKIIYMPSVPPFSRSEKIEDYAASCRPVVWREERIKAADGTKLALAVGEIPREMSKQDEDESKVLVHGRRRRVVVVYFQGNGASIPPRLPALASILRSLNASHTSTTYTILALSYRGFWTSSGRASEAGIKLDAAAALSWAMETFHSSTVGCEEDVRFVLWGQSLGAGVAADAAAALTNRLDTSQSIKGMKIDGLLLETPFAGKDELVPGSQGLELEACASALKLAVQRIEIKGALHNEVTMKASGKAAIVQFLRDIGDTHEEHSIA